MDTRENSLGRVVARALGDEAFKERLLADPAGVLAEAGVTISEGVTVRVVVDTETERTLVIPRPPAGDLGDAELGRLLDEELGLVAGGRIEGCGGIGDAVPGLQCQ